MATMEELIKSVLTELRYATGRDVQVHLQDFIGQKICQLYRALMLKHTFRDYTSTLEFTTDVNGEVINITDHIDRFTDIVAIYPERGTTPLPVAPVRTNPNTLRHTCVVASRDVIFRIYPLREHKITVITRNISHSNFTMDDEVPFYPDLLVLGTAVMLASASGVDESHKQLLQGQFDALVRTYTMNEMQDTYAISGNATSIPEDWYVNG